MSNWLEEEKERRLEAGEECTASRRNVPDQSITCADSLFITSPKQAICEAKIRVEEGNLRNDDN